MGAMSIRLKSFRPGLITVEIPGGTVSYGTCLRDNGRGLNHLRILIDLQFLCWMEWPKKLITSERTWWKDNVFRLVEGQIGGMLRWTPPNVLRKRAC